MRVQWSFYVRLKLIPVGQHHIHFLQPLELSSGEGKLRQKAACKGCVLRSQADQAFAGKWNLIHGRNAAEEPFTEIVRRVKGESWFFSSG